MEHRNEVTANVWDSGRWSGEDSANFDFMTRYIAEHIGAHLSFKGKRVLELGSGLGRLSYLMLSGGASHVTLVDSSRRAVEISRGLFSDIDKGRYSIIEGDLFSFDPKEKFDIVFSSGVIEHFKGDDRRRIVSRHIGLASSDALIIHPTDTLYALFFNNLPMAVSRYGYQRSFSVKEIDGCISAFNAGCRWTHDRFHPFYTVPLLHNLAPLNRMLDNILPGRLGGLTLTHIKVPQ